MSTPSFTAQSLSTVSRRTVAILAAAVAAVALALVVLALSSGTKQPTTANAKPVTSTPPAQSIGTLNYRHSFAPAGNYTPVAVNTPFAGQR
jgi:hypothetical protein